MGVHISFPDDDLNRTVDAAQMALYAKRQELLELLGVQLLSLEKLAYVEKSRGGRGGDGITWKAITVGTLMARLRKAGHLKGNVIAKSVKKNQPLLKQLARAGVTFHDRKGKRLSKNQPLHKQGTLVGVDEATRRRRIKVAPDSYQIGVDTGAQLNSAGPSYSATDGKGGNILKIEDNSVTVGFGRSYTEYFDKARPLIPVPLPADWIQKLEEIATEHGAKIIQDTFKGKGLS